MLLQMELLGPETLPLLLITAGLLISMAEALAPGANFIVVGIALLGAGLVGLALGPLASPIVLAVLVLLFGSVAFYGYRELDIYGGKGQAQTRDSDSLKGQTGRVTETVTPTGGEVKLASGGFNPYYSARSIDGEIPVDTEVLVIDPGGGNVITVESLEVVEDEIDRELARGREAAEAADVAAEAAKQEAEGAEDDRDSDRETERDSDRETERDSDRETERER
ncbi:membrane protein implicated in regulation of membrane protease activity [Halalkaliarchaeum desulfuricum]|uniref:Membrane protein implicated in regulation of membrane protease activity n=1 Tax=Halalkaliarchaeum desulfuricum TaxID=2055893 RepID=A0A343TKJ3_9EURY|nr:NfeD family protein [Halalkaliarchaeum desulfuricum]AUX09615.1 membrane protein implicated in regulation of membrane protease activity [Halalkaliarchaeum desulfuricum]